MKVLVVEDDPATRLVLSRMLTDRSYDVVACATAEEAVEAYKTGFYPLLFLDLFLPGMDGFSLCRWVRSQPDGDQHLILVGTASHRKEDLQKILDAGADDYIAKPYQADVLEVRLIIAQRRVRVIETRAALETSLRQKRERLHYLATHDPLTELLNRAMLMEKLQNAVQTARTGDRSALLYIDLDNFKLINDSLGHAAGDKLLAKVATALRKSVRSQDVAFRVGGDEFAVLLRDIGLEKAQAISERVLAQIQEFAFSDSTKTFIVGASIGIAMIDGTAGGEEVMGFADSACYSAKAHGRNRVEAYDGSDESMVEFHSQLPRAAEIKEAIGQQAKETSEQLLKTAKIQEENLRTLQRQATASLLTAQIQGLTSRVQGYNERIQMHRAKKMNSMSAERRTEDDADVSRMRNERDKLYRQLDRILGDLKIGTTVDVPPEGTYCNPFGTT